MILSDRPSKSVIKFANVADVHKRRLMLMTKLLFQHITVHTLICSKQTKKKLTTAYFSALSVIGPSIVPRKTSGGSAMVSRNKSSAISPTYCQKFRVHPYRQRTQGIIEILSMYIYKYNKCGKMLQPSAFFFRYLTEDCPSQRQR